MVNHASATISSDFSPHELIYELLAYKSQVLDTLGSVNMNLDEFESLDLDAKRYSVWKSLLRLQELAQTLDPEGSGKYFLIILNTLDSSHEEIEILVAGKQGENLSKIVAIILTVIGYQPNNHYVLCGRRLKRIIERAL